MKFPAETKPVLWGVVGGAVALAIVGFGWGGWTTAGTARQTAKAEADTAVVGALAPVCAERFNRAGDAAANLVALRKLEQYAQGEYIEKGGWSSAPGVKPNEHVPDVARACAVLLVTPT